MTVSDGATILFIGDSITDCGRFADAERGLGSGYPLVVSEYLKAFFPHCGFKVLNRGISGNRVRDLEARWQPDCLDLKPDVISILIGINDVWRRYDSADPTSVEDFEAGYRRILKSAHENTDTQIVIMEPFVLPFPADRQTWREDLDLKIAAVRRLAREFADAFVPLDGLFAAACVKRPCEFWAADGVHPTASGHALIAGAFLDAAGLRKTVF